jgi:hypothetical protein
VPRCHPYAAQRGASCAPVPASPQGSGFTEFMLIIREQCAPSGRATQTRLPLGTPKSRVAMLLVDVRV